MDPTNQLNIGFKLNWNEISTCKQLDRNEVPHSDGDLNRIERHVPVDL